jgi:Arc/MetJ family transcription regulator
MRTTLNLDDEALGEAMKTEPNKTKTDLINEALREFVRRRKIQDLLAFEGKMHWQGDLDDLRKRKGRETS